MTTISVELLMPLPKDVGLTLTIIDVLGEQHE